MVERASFFEPQRDGCLCQFSGCGEVAVEPVLAADTDVATLIDQDVSYHPGVIDE